VTLSCGRLRVGRGRWTKIGIGLEGVLGGDRRQHSHASSRGHELDFRGIIEEKHTFVGQTANNVP